MAEQRRWEEQLEAARLLGPNESTAGSSAMPAGRSSDHSAMRMSAADVDVDGNVEAVTRSNVPRLHSRTSASSVRGPDTGRVADSNCTSS